VSLCVAQQPGEKELASSVSETRLRNTVRALVGFGNRMGGTVSGNRAAGHIAQRLQSLGLHVDVIDEPAYLTFDSVSWSLKVLRPPRLRRLIKNEWLAPFSPTVPTTRARLVYWTEGGSKKDSMRGKIVLTERHVSPELYERFVDAGALAVLSYAPNLPQVYEKAAMITSLPRSSSNPLPLFNLSRSNGERLRKELEREIVELEFSSKSSIKERAAKSVVGTLHGEEESYFILCAHGDSDAGGPGADDNASGVAGVVEAARVLTSLVRNRVVAKPTFSIKFIVWGTEYLSAQHFLKMNRDAIGMIKGVLNFDEIGTGATRDCIYFESNDVPHNEQLLRLLEKIGEEYVGKKGFWKEATTNPSQGGTDSYVFLPDYLETLDVPTRHIPSTTIYTAAWNQLRTIAQTRGWLAKSWKGHPDSVTVDYSAFYHSSLDIPEFTTEREPYNMVWGVKAAGIALLRLAWERETKYP
jgi:hypothetical protein